MKAWNISSAYSRPKLKSNPAFINVAEVLLDTKRNPSHESLGRRNPARLPRMSANDDDTLLQRHDPPFTRGCWTAREIHIPYKINYFHRLQNYADFSGGQTVVRVVLEDLSGLGTSIRTMAGPYVTLALIVGPPLWYWKIFPLSRMSYAKSMPQAKHNAHTVAQSTPFDDVNGKEPALDRAHTLWWR